jgi:anti-sigma factor RsiW
MTRIEGERMVAGLRCGEVLALLSDYLDGDLAPERRARLEDHLRGCEACARFGGEFRDTVRALKVHLAGAVTLPSAARERLRRALDDGA